MAKYLMINDNWVSPHYKTFNTWDEMLPIIKESLELNQSFKIDCFNGSIKNPQPPTIKEYREFLVNMINTGIGEDYKYFC